MSELDSKSPGNEEQKPSERIGITYHGVLAERMDWRRDVLGQFEQAADLRTAVEITNTGNPEEFDIVGIGDTLALRKVGNIQDLFLRRKSPKRFLAVERNPSQARAKIVIDDQGLTSEFLKHGKKFDENIFTQQVNKLVKEGLRSILSAEKRHQLNTSLRIEAALISPLLVSTPGFLLAIEGIIVNNSTTWIVGAVLAAMGSRVGKELGFSVLNRTRDKLEKESNFAYFDEFSNFIATPKHLANLRQGRRFLAEDRNSVVTIKAD